MSISSSGRVEKRPKLHKGRKIVSIFTVQITGGWDGIVGYLTSHEAYCLWVGNHAGHTLLKKFKGAHTLWQIAFKMDIPNFDYNIQKN